METTTYLLPAFWASALVNDDYTGLTDADHETLNEWLMDVSPGRCLSASESLEFTKWHDARDYVLACDCLTFTFA